MFSSQQFSISYAAFHYSFSKSPYTRYLTFTINNANNSDAYIQRKNQLSGWFEPVPDEVTSEYM